MRHPMEIQVEESLENTLKFSCGILINNPTPVLLSLNGAVVMAVVVIPSKGRPEISVVSKHRESILLVWYKVQGDSLRYAGQKVLAKEQEDDRRKMFTPDVLTIKLR